MEQKPKTIVLGVTGGIAAYKIAELASRLTKEGFDVHVMMTENATEFITPLTFETLTGNKCILNTFARDFEWDVKHISLAKRADVFLVAPATANVIAKLAHGIADDMLTTTALAMRCPIILSPSMNTAMYENPVTQRNLTILKELGHTIIEAEEGVLACRDIGKGRLPRTEILYEFLMEKLCTQKDLTGKRILVTAGPTCEPLDPVRYLTNHSTGKMGYAIARAAFRRGAQVVLISGKTQLEHPIGVETVVIETAAEMFEAVKDRFSQMDWVIKSAAVADFTPKQTASEKIKKAGRTTMTLELEGTEDILAYLGREKRAGQKLCGFSMETERLNEHSKQKLERKNADLIVANNLKDSGAGFGVDTNLVTLITKDNVIPLELMSKEEVANKVLDAMLQLS